MNTKNIKKPLLIAGVVSTLTLGAVSGMGVVSAATGSPDSNLADKIASKFNLDKNEVRAVFEQEQNDRKAERQKQLEEKLNQAVTDGKLTASQKEQILAKVAELKTYHESIEGKTHSERRELMKTKMQELKTWAEDNDIPTEYLHFGRGHGGHGGPRH